MHAPRPLISVEQMIELRMLEEAAFEQFLTSIQRALAATTTAPLSDTNPTLLPTEAPSDRPGLTAAVSLTSRTPLSESPHEAEELHHPSGL